jgi:tetratricopeptide (TPR) repeat protein
MQYFTVGELIKSHRVKRGLSQQYVVDRLPIKLRAYQGWEGGDRVPRKHLSKIVEVFNLSKTEADELYRAADQVAPETSEKENLPFPKNPFFTGRKTYLELLEYHFNENGNNVIVSISGLGGIGKTQLALEYAHRCCNSEKYRAVLWVNAANKATLETSYLSLANLLQLPEKSEREVDRIVQAVMGWLRGHPNWLLILDNVDDFEIIRSFLPTRPRGHILLTTRSEIVSTIGTAAQIKIGAMEQEEGLLFLLRRSQGLQTGAEQGNVPSNVYSAALQLVQFLGSHPLALDQAGAYINEAGTSFDNYIRLYHQQRYILLNKYGSLNTVHPEHPETVVVTFEISLQRASELCPAARDVLHICSFLHPDDIPEELLNFDAHLRQNSMLFDKAIAALRRYSLIKRNVEKKHISVHRLVQEVVQDSILESEQVVWIERVIAALEAVFPEGVHPAWSAYERLLPHVLTCATRTQSWKNPLPGLAPLLFKTALYLAGRAQYLRAEPLFQQALRIWEQVLGSKHPNMIYPLTSLAELYREQGKYERAEELYQRALHIREQEPGLGRPDMATLLNNLASLYREQGKYVEAEPLYQWVLRIREQELGSGHPDLVIPLNNLAELYTDQEKYEQAELLYLQSLQIRERALGPEHPQVVVPLKKLAECYMKQGKYVEAEPLYQRVLRIQERVFRPESPDLIYPLDDLAGCYRKQGKLAEAEPLYRQALSLCEQESFEHPLAAYPLRGLAECYMEQGKYVEAEPLYQRALQVWEQDILDPEHPDVASPLIDLAECYREQGKYEDAVPLYRRALALQEQALGPQHWKTVETRMGYAALLRTIGLQDIPPEGA